MNEDESKVEKAPSIEQVLTEFEGFQSSWNELRLSLIQDLPHDIGRVKKVDRLMVEAGRYLERATRAEKRRQKLRGWWWYIGTLAAIRDINNLTEILCERGLKAQNQANSSPHSASPERA